MNEKFNNKYRRGSHRFPEWNYAGDGMYYITLVTQGRECHLGKIENGEMHFSDFGNIVKDQFLQSFEMRTELFLDEYVIMPNHIHTIVVLINRDGTGRKDGGCCGSSDQSRNRINQNKKKATPKIRGSFFAEREGFEPPDP